LRGDIRVKVEGVGAAAVTSLKLVAADEDYTSWHLDTQQIEDMARSLGLQRPDNPLPPETLPERLQNTQTPWTWTIVVSAVLALGGLLLWRRRQRPGRSV
jgi:hypothetical protein